VAWKWKKEDTVNGSVSEYVNAYTIRFMKGFISDTNIIFKYWRERDGEEQSVIEKSVENI
jgi:hypothetical protein